MNEDEYCCCNCIFNAMCTPFEKLKDNCLGECRAYTDYEELDNYSWKRYADNNSSNMLGCNRIL